MLTGSPLGSSAALRLAVSASKPSLWYSQERARNLPLQMKPTASLVGSPAALGLAGSGSGPSPWYCVVPRTNLKVGGKDSRPSCHPSNARPAQQENAQLGDIATNSTCSALKSSTLGLGWHAQRFQDVHCSRGLGRGSGLASVAYSWSVVRFRPVNIPQRKVLGHRHGKNFMIFSPVRRMMVSSSDSARRPRSPFRSAARASASGSASLTRKTLRNHKCALICIMVCVAAVYLLYTVNEQYWLKSY